MACGQCKFYKADFQPTRGPFGFDGSCSNMQATLGQRGIPVSKSSNQGCKYFDEMKVSATLNSPQG